MKEGFLEAVIWKLGIEGWEEFFWLRGEEKGILELRVWIKMGKCELVW